MLMKPLTVVALSAALVLPAAHAAVTTGALDSITGLQWAYASSVGEGQSLGYRAATIDDFQTLLTDAGLAVNVGQGSAIRQSAFGFGPSSDGQGNTQLGSLTFAYGSILGMAPQKSLSATTLATSSIGVAFGWLGGQAGQMGAVGHYEDERSLPCGTGGVCATVMQTRTTDLAGWGTVEELMAGQHSTLVSATDGSTPWSLGLQRSVGANWGYHMVKTSAVPEASTGLTLALGLLGLGLSARRARRSH
jgi:MYXO-CTERM domain-containing protein